MAGPTNGIRHAPALFQATFVLSVGLFATSIFLYAHARSYLLLVVLVTVAVAGFAVARALLWPDSVTLRVALEISYRLIAIIAAVQVMGFRWGRGELGPWFLAVSLLGVHLDWAPISSHLPYGFSLMAELMLGLSMGE